VAALAAALAAVCKSTTGSSLPVQTYNRTHNGRQQRRRCTQCDPLIQAGNSAKPDTRRDVRQKSTLTKLQLNFTTKGYLKR